MKNIQSVITKSVTDEKEYVDMMHFTHIRHYIKDTPDHREGDAIVLRAWAKPKEENRVQKKKKEERKEAVHYGDVEL